MYNLSVAVVDTGIFLHRDFGNRVVGFTDTVAGKLTPYDDSGHGTHVSGIIAGNGTASNGRHKGMAPFVNLVGVKVLDSSGNGRIENVLKGMEWILENSRLYNIRVVNISFGMIPYNCEEEKELLVNIVEKLWDKGIVVVAAAGNSGPEKNSVTAPGISRKIITVGSYDDLKFTDSKGRRVKFYSGRGPTEECIVKPEVVVMGAGIISTSNRPDSYSMKSGTSMSAPIVSGAVARVLYKNPSLTPKDVKVRVYNNCKKIGIPQNQQGWGMLDVYSFISG